MKLRISSISERGNLEGERIALKANSDGDAGRYAVFKGITKPTGVASGNIANVYWFMDKQFKAGDFIVLYSKEGRRSEKKNDDGTTSYFFYWGLSLPIWTAGATPVLVETATWSFGSPIE